MNIKKLNKETQPNQKIIEDLINLHTTGKLDDAKKKILSYIKKPKRKKIQGSSAELHEVLPVLKLFKDNFK